MIRWTGWIVWGLLLFVAPPPAQAHDLPAIEIARLDALVTHALNSRWSGVLVLMASGIGLGALHGLEPGHAKTMMSAFIIAIRGTVGQAVLLGASATVSHTAVVWLLVVPVLAWGGAADLRGNEPYFQIASAIAVLAVAGWTLLRVIRADGRMARVGAYFPTEATISEAVPGAARVVDTGHGLVRLEIADIEGQSHFVVRGVARSGRAIAFDEDVALEVRRRDDARETFLFAARGDAQISVDPVAAPHSFVATLRIGHGDHTHDCPLIFGDAPMPVAESEGYADAHERVHAETLRRQLAGGRPMTRWQVILFGLSGGLLPCPAAVTVLLLCLQLKRVALGVLLVGSFSLGLALTMIAAGAIAAVGARQLGRRWGGFAAFSRVATYASGALILVIGLYMLVQGIDGLA